jgi:hypothetical protein
MLVLESARWLCGDNGVVYFGGCRLKSRSFAAAGATTMSTTPQIDSHKTSKRTIKTTEQVTTEEPLTNENLFTKIYENEHGGRQLELTESRSGRQ